MTSAAPSAGGGLTPNLVGALWMLGSAAAYTLMTVLLKGLGEDYPAALQALWALDKTQGSEASIAEVARTHVAVDPSLSTTPDASRAPAYAAAYARFLQHIDAVTPLQRG